MLGGEPVVLTKQRKRIWARDKRKKKKTGEKHERSPPESEFSSDDWLSGTGDNFWGALLTFIPAHQLAKGATIRL